jgi:hypothetical protein
MVTLMSPIMDLDPRHTIESPQTLEELKVTVHNMEAANRAGNRFSADTDVAVRPEPIPFFKKVKTFFSRK